MSRRSRSRRGPRHRPPAVPEEHQGRLVYGLGPVAELLARRADTIAELAVRGGASSDRIAGLVERARAARVPVSELAPIELDALAGDGGNHQGVIARCGPYPYADLDDLVDARPALLLVLDGVTDPRNLGAICRSAYLLGATGVVVPKDRSAPINAAATKASAGATEIVPIARVTNLARALGELRDAGLWRALIAGVEGARPLTEIDGSMDLALIVGSEGKGVRPLVAKQTDFAFAIPMAGEGVGSFNVAVAASLALYEVARQRGA